MAGVSTVHNGSLYKLRSLNGIFSIYKKQGPTSPDVLNTLKKDLLKEAGVKNPNTRKRKKQPLKIGHGGTLDSNAAGVLVVGIGEGTKMLTTMLAGSKKYSAVGELGKETDTLDVTGNVVEEKSYDHITKEAFEEKLKEFTGEIMQVPPLYSALKKDGKRMSVLLKQGQEVKAKPAHPVTVYNLSLQDFSPPHFTIDAECGGGFYVRSLIDGLGKALSSCAHVKELTRTALREDHWTLTDISQALQPCPKPTGQQKNTKKAKSKDKPSPFKSKGDDGDQNND
ncbi:pseudouridylate synthase TRUB1-like [Myxocyprinus asiaticus]|uniref:pseudouridylate synthase TRUB1-like n=1 Tax=Myxocyprinus asiaticus TaxID=70543 RepID=UPI0022222D50|nr:pseudouridylate synthase TRUB1-like [Myxocyprinus asiaticus]